MTRHLLWQQMVANVHLRYIGHTIEKSSTCRCKNVYEIIFSFFLESSNTDNCLKYLHHLIFSGRSSRNSDRGKLSREFV